MNIDSLVSLVLVSLNINIKTVEFILVLTPNLVQIIGLREYFLVLSVS